MSFDQMKKVQKEHNAWICSQPHCVSTDVRKNEAGDVCLCIFYKPGTTIAVKKKIATELGDIQLKWIEKK